MSNSPAPEPPDPIALELAVIHERLAALEGALAAALNVLSELRRAEDVRRLEACATLATGALH